MVRPLQSFTIATADGNTVSLGQADNGLIVGVHVAGAAFPALARLSREEAEQLAEILGILLLTNAAPVASKIEAAVEPAPVAPAKPVIKTAKKK